MADNVRRILHERVVTATYSQLLEAIRAGYSDSAYILTRLLVRLALTRIPRSEPD